VTTIPEMVEKVKFEGDQVNALFAKNLYLANKKKKDQVYLVVAAHDTAIDMKGLTNLLKAGSGNLRGGDPEEMERLLGVKKGAVNVFAILNDTAMKVTLIIDSRLAEKADLVAFHPMQNDATTAISRADLNKIIELSKHKPMILDFSTIATAAPATATDGAKAVAGEAKKAPATGGAKPEKKAAAPK
jgi:Ala-tRNA(Pro) deacylase